MAESVDALVSNTSGATHPGSIPGLGTQSGSRVICFPTFFYMFSRTAPFTERIQPDLSRQH